MKQFIARVKDRGGSALKGFLVFSLFLFVGIPYNLHAASSEEYKVKLAFIYNFAKFIEWPSQAFNGEDSPLELCILGEDPFEGSTASIENKPVGRRSLQVKRARKLEEVKGCHILYISASEKDHLEQILKRVSHSNLLTVSDADRFITAGGIIGFVMVDRKIRFEVNLDAARIAGLEISSKLLNVAETVQSNSN